jgi:hypothetical protein
LNFSTIYQNQNIINIHNYLNATMNLIYPHQDIIDIGIDYASGLNYILLDNNIMMYITINDDIFFRNIWNNDHEYTSYDECKQSLKNKAI